MSEIQKEVPDPLTPHARYHQDVSFRTLVDMVYAMIEQRQFTLAELREAVILASMMYEINQINQARQGMTTPTGCNIRALEEILKLQQTPITSSDSKRS